MNQKHARQREGMTLIEVMVVMLLVALIAAVLIQSVATSRRLTYMISQRSAAFGMCHAKLEEIRAMDYGDVATKSFPVESDLRFAHLGGKKRIPLACSRTVTVTPDIDPVRKEIQVMVTWEFLGNTIQENVWAILYPR